MEWTRSETIALAKNSCAHCHGIGLHLGRGGRLNPCGCVLRKIFRCCLNRYWRIQELQAVSGLASSPTFSPFPHGADRRGAWGRKKEEYCADFFLVARRALLGARDGRGRLHWAIFVLHFLQGRDWKICTKLLRMDRGNFFHAVYRIEQALGRVFRELRPYSIFPTDLYFNGWRSEVEAAPAPPPARARPATLAERQALTRERAGPIRIKVPDSNQPPDAALAAGTAAA